MNNRLLSRSAGETIAFGHKLASSLKAPALLLFYGDLGSGKTTLIKGVIQSLCGIAPEEVQSPTFVYMQVYRGHKTIYHYDLYRLTHDDEFYALGLDETLDAGGIACIEWPEKVPSLPKKGAIHIHCKHIDEETRSIEVTYGA